jgi:trimethylamine--corrinoid protein Co-methyltransferase
MKPIQLNVFTQDEKQRIHEATLNILEKVGVRIFDKKMRALLYDHGAYIDEINNLVKLPPNLVMESLSLAPKSFNLVNRVGDKLPIPTADTYICSRLLLPKILDYGKDKPRDPNLNDVIKACQLANAFDDVDLVLRTDAPVNNPDVQPELNNLLSIETALTFTAKHFLCIPINIESMKDWILLAEAATESGDLAKEPIMTLEVSTTAPLQLDYDSCNILRLGAEKGLPVMAMPMPAGGGTAPITTAGEIVAMNAETLFIIVVTQLIRPGCPSFYGGIPCTFDLRTGIISLASPEFPLMTSGSLEMGRYYGLPLLSASKYTDSLTFDEQCGAEKIMSAFASLVSGADIIYGNGDLDTALVLSFEQIVIDLDLVLAARRFVHGIMLDLDRLAIDVIQRVGPGGHYLEDRHTLTFLRSGEQLAPKTYNRLGHRSSSRPQIEMAHEIVDNILSKPPEPAITKSAITRIHTAVQERRVELLANHRKIS